MLPNWTFWGNTLQAWLLAIMIMLVSFFVFFLLRKLAVRSLTIFAKKTENVLGQQLAEMVQTLQTWPFVILSVYIASLALVLPDTFFRVSEKIVVVMLLALGGFWGNRIVSLLIHYFIKQKQGDDEISVATVTAVGFLGKLALWVVVFLLILANLGIDITALVAGLGIGGIAVALAVQNVLGDLLGSFSIVLDKPFVIGDFIVIDNFMGNVEHIGLKTTHIRSLSGEQVVFSNSDLLKSRIRNYKRMSERRVLFTLSVTYDTPYEKLKAIPDICRAAIEEQDTVRFDRAHFKEYGPYAFSFEIVYWLLDADYNLYMDVQQAINLSLLQHFQTEGIKLAYPTQTLYIEPRPSEELAPKAGVSELRS